MDHAEVAKRIVRKIFDQAEADGRVMHRDRMDKLVEDVLREAEPARSPYLYGLVAPESRDGAPLDHFK